MGFDECPNYIETLWHEQGNPQPKIVRDCAPKRSLLMLQELYNRTFSLQQQVNQQEGEVCSMRGAVQNLYKAFQYFEEHRVLEKSAKEKLARHLGSMKHIESEQFKRIE